MPKLKKNAPKTIGENKKHIGVRIPKRLFDDIQDYSKLTNHNTTDIVTIALNKYFENKTVRNTYLNNIAGLYFSIPINTSLKHHVIEEKIILNDVDKSELDNSEDYINIRIHRVPNNLDLFINDTYKSNKRAIDHAGIEFFIYKDYFNNSDIYSMLDIDLRECLFCFYFEVAGNNKSAVKLISPVESINELSQVNQNRLIDDVVGVLEKLDHISYSIRENLSQELEQEEKKNHNYISNSKCESLTKDYRMMIRKELTSIANDFNTGMVEESFFDKSIS